MEEMYVLMYVCKHFCCIRNVTVALWGHFTFTIGSVSATGVECPAQRSSEFAAAIVQCVCGHFGVQGSRL